MPHTPSKPRCTCLQTLLQQVLNKGCTCLVMTLAELLCCSIASCPLTYQCMSNIHPSDALCFKAILLSHVLTVIVLCLKQELGR